MEHAAAMLRGQLTDIAAGSIFLFVGLVTFAIAMVRRRLGVRMLAWLGAWSAMYGAIQLSQTEAVIAALPAGLQAAASPLNAACMFLLIVAALLAFRELSLGRLRTLVEIVALVALAVAAAGIAEFVATGAASRTMPLNSLLAVGMLLILAVVVAVPRLAARYLAIQDRRVLAAGILVFALEALYNSLSRPLGITPLRLFDHLGFAVLLSSFGFVALQTVFANERRLLAVEDELAIASRIQMAILPSGTPPIRRLQMSAAYRPMTAVAGDFYEFIPVDPQRVGILVADVAGHGVPAALIASMIKVAVQAVAAGASDPAAVLGGLNRILSAHPRSQLISAAYLWLDTERMEARYSAAGHPPLLLWRQGAIDRLDSNGCLIGMDAGGEYPVRTFAIDAGDRFLLYTDGVTDAENGRGEFFGDTRLEAVVRDHRDATPAEFVERLLSEVAHWRPASVPQQDDVTIVAINVASR